MGARSEVEFAEFYDATWSRTLACAFGLTGDLVSAEELAQEAYTRAWARWSKLSGYDEPAAWVRQVTTNLAVSRWRRSRTARSWLAHQRAVEPATPADEGNAAIVAALRRLPEPQRRAIVLHHLGDLSVADVARIEGCPEGTVKARLSRGRAALAELMSDTHEPNGAPSHV